MWPIFLHLHPFQDLVVLIKVMLLVLLMEVIEPRLLVVLDLTQAVFQTLRSGLTCHSWLSHTDELLIGLEVSRPYLSLKKFANGKLLNVVTVEAV